MDLNSEELARFLSFVNKTETCWLWTGGVAGKPDNSGQFYAKFWLHGQSVLGHRVSYEHFKGPIPEGLTIDHICRIRLCVNPDHLEAVTMQENTLRSPDNLAAINSRKTECKRGHPYTPENTLLQKNGKMCRECRNSDFRRYHARQKAKKLAAAQQTP